MTVKSAKPPARRTRRRSNGAAGLAAYVSRKPQDVEALHRLAEQLNGRPVPGLRMTEAEYEAWADSDVNSEWVDGEVILMPPVSMEQADLFGWLYRIVSQFVEDRELGKGLGPEFTIRLPRQRRRRVPDILVVLKNRLSLLRQTYLEGAPDVAFEIVSPDSVVRDWREKYEEYQAAGVREYWVLDPTTRRVEAYVLRGRKYHRIEEDDEHRIASRTLKGFFLRSTWLWKATPPRVAAVLRELGSSGR